MTSHHGRGNGISPEPYHFIKIILQSTIRDGKLGIPGKFARDYGNTLSSLVFFEVPNGEVWELELKKLEDKMWVQNGWRKFAGHYYLELGHFLVFRYKGNCRFHVLIFDKSASEIHYPYTNDKDKKEILQQEVKIEESQEDDSVRIINNIRKAMRKKPVMQCPRPRKMMRAALERASSTFSSENPFFLVLMQQAYVGCLSIPKKFSRKYLMDNGDVTLCGSDGKIWSAEYQSVLGTNKRPYVRLFKGWGAFVLDNSIRVGDVCAFELTNRKDITFRVFIYPSKKADFHECLDPVQVCERDPQREINACEKALERALSFTSENPYFLLVLRPSYVQSRALCISNRFARKHFKSTLTKVDVSLCLSNGKSWPAEYHQQSIGYLHARICKGWKAFVDDNKLKVGDVCVFELMNDTQISFKVSIFQAIAHEHFPQSQGISEQPLGLISQSAKGSLIFRRVVLPLHLKEQCVDIPFTFVEQYFKPTTEKMILQVADRSWPVKIKINQQLRLAKLTSGWIEFARENSLSEGDICVYELDTTDNSLLKVSISKRAS